jgi:cold shock CspA family protein
MQIPVQVTFSNMTPSDAVRARVEQLAEKLERFHDRIMGCRVLIRAPNHRRTKGRLYHVSIDLTAPGHEIVINRDSPQDQSHEDVYVAIRDAFEAAARRLEDIARARRGDVKTHDAEPQGKIAQLFRDRSYGFIEDEELGEIYFHANSVAGGEFAKLMVGTPVRYRAEPGDKGLQATIVKPL